jgi:prepilin-type N-terminal cleavage/methylation domain-containing protein
MMFKGLILAGKQKGFTLIELIVALGIAGILGAGIAATTVSIGNTNDRNVSRVMAIKEVENAIHFLNRDIQQAQKVEINGTGYWIRLTWTSWDNNTLNQVVYNVDNETLIRQYFGSDPSSNKEIARYITEHSAARPNPTPTPTTLPSEKTWTISITSEYTSGFRTASETRLIKVVPRTGY